MTTSDEKPRVLLKRKNVPKLYDVVLDDRVVGHLEEGSNDEPGGD